LYDVNYSLRVTELIDPGDLIDAGAVAELLGLSSRNAVSVYRRRYEDFPAPRVERGQNVVLWLRQDVVAWAEERGQA
jgi:predicted DNA-binding transcriptional regulator AlpA